MAPTSGAAATAAAAAAAAAAATSGPPISECVRAAVRAFLATELAPAAAAPAPPPPLALRCIPAALSDSECRVVSNTPVAAPCDTSVEAAAAVAATARRIEEFAAFVSARSCGGAGTYCNTMIAQLHGAHGVAPTYAFGERLWHVICGAEPPAPPPPPPLDTCASMVVTEGASEEADAMRRIARELTCSVCLNTLEEPCQAECTHALCLACARRVVAPLPGRRSVGGGGGLWQFKCPECRATVFAESPGGLLREMRRRARLLDRVCANLGSARCTI